MAELIERIRPTLPPHALRNALLALATGVLLMAGVATLSTWWGPSRLWWEGHQMLAGMQAAGLAALATAVGALPVFLVSELNKRHEAGLLSFAAGVMLAAAIFSLLLPSLEAGQILWENTPLPGLWSTVVAGVGLVLGLVVMLQMDRLLPHEHAVLPPSAGGELTPTTRPAANAVQRAWLMVLALTIHNIPEGLAVGAAYAGFGAEPSTAGASVALAIGLQNMPEGMIVAMALRSLGHSAGKAWVVAVFSGLAEPLGAWLGLAALGSMPALYPLGLALAAGTMLFVVSHEIIPETHRNGHETLATSTLLGGFIFMLVLSEALGG